MAKGNFGERLKRERELREVSLKEITSATRIGPRFLEALENEEWDRLPGGVFNRGFVRAIARYLGLNEENLLAEYDLAHGEPSAPSSQTPDSQIPRPPIWVPVVALLAILAVVAGLVAGGIYGWRRYAAHRAAKKSSSSTSIPAQMQPEDSVMSEVKLADSSSTSEVAQASVPLDLSISASAATRARIFGDGAVLLDAELLQEKRGTLRRTNSLRSRRRIRRPYCWN
jgi:cytoskeleton protein RodZ